MKRFACLVLLPLLAGAQSEPLDLTSRTIVMPMYRRVFDFRMPLGYVQQPMQRNAKQVLFEFVPEGETVENWTRLITVRAIRDTGASSLSTREIAAVLFDPKRCGSSGRLTVGPEQVIAGALKRVTIALSCGRSPGNGFPGDKKGAGEQDFIYLFRDDQHAYSLNVAFRGPGFDTPPIDFAKADAVLTETFGRVLLCGSDTEPDCKKTIDFARANGSPW